MSSSLWKCKVEVDQESAWHSSALSRYRHFVVDVQLVVDVTSMMFGLNQTEVIRFLFAGNIRQQNISLFQIISKTEVLTVL